MCQCTTATTGTQSCSREYEFKTISCTIYKARARMAMFIHKSKRHEFCGDEREQQLPLKNKIWTYEDQPIVHRQLGKWAAIKLSNSHCRGSRASQISDGTRSQVDNGIPFKKSEEECLRTGNPQSLTLILLLTISMRWYPRRRTGIITIHGKRKSRPIDGDPMSTAVRWCPQIMYTSINISMLNQLRLEEEQYVEMFAIKSNSNPN